MLTFLRILWSQEHPSGTRALHRRAGRPPADATPFARGGRAESNKKWLCFLKSSRRELVNVYKDEEESTKQNTINACCTVQNHVVRTVEVYAQVLLRGSAGFAEMVKEQKRIFYLFILILLTQSHTTNN